MMGMLLETSKVGHTTWKSRIVSVACAHNKAPRISRSPRVRRGWIEDGLIVSSDWNRGIRRGFFFVSVGG